MLIVLNEFRLSTYVLTEKRWIGGLQDSRTNNTLITSVYVFFVDTRKQLYTSTIGCYCCACVRPCWWILVSAVSKTIDGEVILVNGGITIPEIDFIY